MQSVLAEQALIDQEVEGNAERASLSVKEVQLLKASLAKQSFLQSPNNSFQTILSISNTMVRIWLIQISSSLLLIPVLFQSSGAASSLLLAFFFCLASCKTCTILITHNKDFEMDLPFTIYRILGRKYYLFYNFTNITLLYFVSVAYFILISTIFYSLIESVCQAMNVEIANKVDITLAKMSYQWCGISCMFFLSFIIIQERLGFIIKTVQYGVISIVAYIVFIIIKGTINISQVNQVTVFKSDIFTLSGVFSLAFMPHQAIIPIVKRNEKQKNNARDLAVSFVWAWLVYGLVGCFGAIAIAGKERRKGTDGGTVLDYLERDAFSQIIIVLQLFKLITIYPLLTFIARSQFFTLFFPKGKPPRKFFFIYTFLAALLTLIIQCMNINITIVLSLTGAIIGFFHLYFIPILLHFTCLYRKQSKVQGLGGQNGVSSYESLRELADEEDEECNDHSSLKKRTPLAFRYGFYGALMAVGGVVGVMNLAAIFD